MSAKNFGYTLVGLGIFGTILSLIVDSLGFGKPGIQAAQLLGIQVGVILMILGIGLIKSGRTEKVLLSRLSRSVVDWILNQPTLIWVLTGFIIGYVVLFIFPVFFNPDHRIQYFNRYLPSRAPIGVDFRAIVVSVENWISTKETPNILYSPLFNIFFAPILLLSYPKNYYLLTSLTLISFFVLTFLLPRRISPRENHPIITFIFATAIFSYGLQFELERGQFHTIAFMLCILSIYIFHYHKAYRLFAYLIFSLSIQFKIYPAIFVVLFVENWRDWKINLIRFMKLGFLNIVFLFFLGYSYFTQFIAHLTSSIDTTETWIGNHSIRAFVANLVNSGFGLFPQTTLDWMKAHSSDLEASLVLYFIICFIFVITRAYLDNKPGVNTNLLLVCTIGALVIPSINHDYTLALLAAPFAMAISSLSAAGKDWQKLLAIFLITVSSLAYTITLFPFKYKPEYLANSLPMLIVILTAITLLDFISLRDAR